MYLKLHKIYYFLVGIKKNLKISKTNSSENKIINFIISLFESLFKQRKIGKNLYFINS